MHDKNVPLNFFSGYENWTPSFWRQCRINPFQWTDVDITVDLSARVIIPQPAPIGLQYQLQQQQPHGVAQYILPGVGASIELSIFPTNVDLYN